MALLVDRQEICRINHALHIMDVLNKIRRNRYCFKVKFNDLNHLCVCTGRVVFFKEEWASSGSFQRVSVTVESGEGRLLLFRRLGDYRKLTSTVPPLPLLL